MANRFAKKARAEALKITNIEKNKEEIQKEPVVTIEKNERIEDVREEKKDTNILKTNKKLQKIFGTQKEETKKRKTYYLSQETIDNVAKYTKLLNLKSQNAFIEKALGVAFAEIEKQLKDK